MGRPLALCGFLKTHAYMMLCQSGTLARWHSAKSSFENLANVDMGEIKPIKVHTAAGQGMQIADGFEQEGVSQRLKITTSIKNSSPP